jgi:hypothetical protein
LHFEEGEERLDTRMITVKLEEEKTVNNKLNLGNKE